MKDLRVNLEVDGLKISGYLTDEGLVVDVFDKDKECVATGYEFFSNAGLEAPQPIKEDDDENK